MSGISTTDWGQSEQQLFRFKDAVRRSDLISELSHPKPYDIAIIGGGIHGACIAKLAARQGHKVVLLEWGDYAHATSSRSSKMAHGGLRYLETLDFQQVLEGIKAREDLFENASHLVHPQKFYIPILQRQHFLRFKLALGLQFYDRMTRSDTNRHYWVSEKDIPRDLFGNKKLLGCYCYTDGLMNDARLVLENVIAARRDGALCLNYVKVKAIKSAHGMTELRVRDELTQQEYSLQARIAVNCAGPWAPFLGEVSPDTPMVKYSRGAHIIFSVPWKYPSLFLPMEGKGRYYFVWPHAAGTMVGTTERETAELEEDPLPTRDEIEEILDRLQKDLPDSGLSRENAHYCFAGIRTLPLRKGSSDIARISRKHIWRYAEGMLTLFGGKFTTAEWTAREGMKQIGKILGKEDKPVSSAIAGTLTAGAQTQLIARLTCEHELSNAAAARLVARFGSRAEEFLSHDLDPIDFEVAVALEVEQSETLDDLMRRRLDLEFNKDHGLNEIDKILPLFSLGKRREDVNRQVELYRQRMQKIDTLLGKAGSRVTSP